MKIKIDIFQFFTIWVLKQIKILPNENGCNFFAKNNIKTVLYSQASLK